MKLQFALALGVLGSVPAAAQTALYGAQPPPDSAYVRFANGLASTVAISTDFTPGHQVGTEADDRVGAYAVVDHVTGRRLHVVAQFGTHRAETTLQVEPGRFVTVIIAPAPNAGIALVPVLDQSDYNQARARLVFYNASQTCASGALALAASGTSIFAGIPPGGEKARSVNPAKALLRATCDGQGAPDLALDGLQAGGSYSIWLIHPGDAPLAFVTQDRLLPYKP